jgi:polyisoprenyl-teichoic acid--peptidoglycan teichoic acid transferase
MPAYLGLPPINLPTPLPATPSPSASPPPPFNPTLPPAPTPDFGALLPEGMGQPTGPVPSVGDLETVNILLLGSDQRTGSTFRTDSIIVAAIRPKTGEVTLISFPRDLWVNIPTIGMQRINTAYLYGETTAYPGGGAALLKETITYNFGLRVDNYAIVDFDGFRRVVDTLGGVDVPVVCAYTDWRLISPTLPPEVRENWELYTTGPGVVRMDGDLSLWYARSRQKSNDFDRGRRQQEVLRALYQRALTTDSLARLPQLYTDLRSAVTTDMSLDALLKLAPLSLQVGNANIRSYYINTTYATSWTTPGGAAVLLPNVPAIQSMLRTALASSPRRVQTETMLVEVQNGTFNAGWNALAAERLNYAGYATQLSEAENRPYAASVLYDLTPEQDAQRAASLLAILGLPRSALIAAPQANSASAYIFIVGADYQPCFNPANFAP